MEDYMGFFEHYEFLLKAGSLKLEGFRALFEYRVYNSMANRPIADAKQIQKGAPGNCFLN